MVLPQYQYQVGTANYFLSPDQQQRLSSPYWTGSRAPVQMPAPAAPQTMGQPQSMPQRNVIQRPSAPLPAPAPLRTGSSSGISAGDGIHWTPGVVGGSTPPTPLVQVKPTMPQPIAPPPVPAPVSAKIYSPGPTMNDRRLAMMGGGYRPRPY